MLIYIRNHTIIDFLKGFLNNDIRCLIFFPGNKCLSKYVTYLINIMTENTTNVPLQVQMYCQWYIVLSFCLPYWYMCI